MRAMLNELGRGNVRALSNVDSRLPLPSSVVGINHVNKWGLKQKQSWFVLATK